MHRANLLESLKAYLQTCTERPKGLPARLAIFGVSALPPVYLALYELMAKWCDITLYFLSPSSEYWGDLVAPKQQGQQALDFVDEAEPNESGHPLLASLGKQGQDFFEQLQQCEHTAESLFSMPDGTQLLGQLQSNWLLRVWLRVSDRLLGMMIRFNVMLVIARCVKWRCYMISYWHYLSVTLICHPLILW